MLYDVCDTSILWHLAITVKLSKQSPYSLNISRGKFLSLRNVAKNKNFADLQTLPKCIRLWSAKRGLIAFSIVCTWQPVT